MKQWVLAKGETTMQSQGEIVVFAEHGCIRDGGIDGGKASGQLLQHGWLQLR